MAQKLDQHGRQVLDLGRKRGVDRLLRGLHVAKLLARDRQHDAGRRVTEARVEDCVEMTTGGERIAGLERCLPGAHCSALVDGGLAFGRLPGGRDLPRRVSGGNREQDLTQGLAPTRMCPRFQTAQVRPPTVGGASPRASRSQPCTRTMCAVTPSC
jgi:hypothetical protein